jgi:hypothetical protein
VPPRGHIRGCDSYLPAFPSGTLCSELSRSGSSSFFNESCFHLKISFARDPGDASAGNLRRRRVLYLTIEKRINFTIEALKPTAPARLPLLKRDVALGTATATRLASKLIGCGTQSRVRPITRVDGGNRASSRKNGRMFSNSKTHASRQLAEKL